MGSRVSSPILVGRAAELALLEEVFAGALAGTAGCVLVGGEAGIGKTRLITEFAARAAAAGALVIEGAAISIGDDEGLPYGPLAEALRGLARRLSPAELATVVGASGGELGRLVPELSSGPAEERDPIRPDWAQTRLFEGLLSLLARASELAPVCLVVEDLHWADRSTRDVLAFLARNARTERVLIVATFRTDELHRRHPLRPWLVEVERAARVRRLDLRRLGRDELREQLRAIMGAEPTAGMLEAIARRSEGNPFFAEELLASGSADGEGLPDTLREVLLTRIGHLSEEGQQVLAAAAVGGQSVRHDLLAAAWGGTEESLEAGLRAAVAAQLLVPGREGGRDHYTFRHALLREAAEEDLLPNERRRLHAAFATALRGEPVPTGAEGASHLAQLAHHAGAALRLGDALAAWVDAARASAASYAYAEAGRAFERAIALWAAVPPDDRPVGVDEVQLFHEGAWAQLNAGELRRARELATEAVARVDPAPDPERAADVRERLARVVWVTGDLEPAIRILEEAAALLDGRAPTPASARVHAGLASALMLRGAHERAQEVARTAIAVAREIGADAAEANATNTLGVSLAINGDCAAGIAALERARATTTDPHDLGRTFTNLSSVLSICGRLEESVAVALEGWSWSTRLGFRRTYGIFHATNAASALVDLGRWPAAVALLDELADIEPLGVARLAYATVAGPLAVWLGRTDLARELLGGAFDQVRGFSDAQFTAPTYLGLVELALAERRYADAARLVDEGLARLARTDDHPLRAQMLELGVRVAADRAEAARAARQTASEIVAPAEPVLAELRGLGAAAPAGWGDDVRALVALGEAELRRLHGRSDPAAWADAVERLSPRRAYHAWYARYRQAEALLEGRGDRSQAAAYLSEVRLAADRAGAIPLRDAVQALARRARITLSADRAPEPRAALDRADAAEQEPARSASADPYGLTAREREVLRLVAGGFTNRRIGEALFISESTAGVHVSNILAKLGVASRAEAAAVAARLGMDREPGEPAGAEEPRRSGTTIAG